MRGRLTQVVLLGVLLIVGTAIIFVFAPAFLRVAHRAQNELQRNLAVLTFANPIFYIGTLMILLAERRWPAQKRQKTLSVGLCQDFVWLFFESLLHATILTTFAAVLRAFYRGHLSFLTLHAAAAMPLWLRFILAMLAVDFIAFFHHWLRHKVGVFWLFHTVHHSQRELNIFTDVRYHVFEYVIAYAVRIFPMMALNFDLPEIISYVLAHQWYTRFCHANIRTNLGMLRFVLVTPQSHRVHHSPHRRHWDKNFGVIFSVWDRLLGTQYRNDREYPRTGIPDGDFPMETSARPLALLVTPVLQHIYPFGVIFRRVRDGPQAGRLIVDASPSRSDLITIPPPITERNPCASSSSPAFSQSP